MDGIHDLGGLHGFGPVPRGGDAERAFSSDWQRRVFGCAVAARLTNVDAFRHSLERLDPLTYLANGYWGRWLAALEGLARDTHRVSAAGGGAARELERPPAFAIGEPVRTVSHGVPGHTRLPRYARGRAGVVVAERGGWVLPDRNAHGEGEDPQHVYSVRFTAQSLFGPDAESAVSVHLDLFESYLRKEASDE